VCSPHQNWVYYGPQAKQIWRVPLDGSGKPEPIPGSAVPRAILIGRGMGISPVVTSFPFQEINISKCSAPP
jgi:hypothetical protein